MAYMVVTLEVSKLSGWLNTDASCRESKGGHACGASCRPPDGRRREAAEDRGARSVQGRARLQIGGRARGGAHREHTEHARDAGGVKAQRLVEQRRAPEHLGHGRDARGFPVGDVRIEIPQVLEEPAHVGDGRDVPFGDGAVRRNGGGRVSVVRIDRRLQGGRAREGVGRRRRRRRRGRRGRRW
eukprot:scaffold54948_cov49-Phaeocystis_antarctica.AAC.2